MFVTLPRHSISNLRTVQSSPLAVIWHRRYVFHRNRKQLVHSMAACSEAIREERQQEQDETNVMHMLADAHCHPQLDPANMKAVMELQCSHVAAMSVSYDVDWDIMLQLHKTSGAKLIPGFGIHPWWSHLHASSHGTTWQQLLESSSPDQLQSAVDVLAQHDPVTNSGAYATNRPDKPLPSCQQLDCGQQQQQQVVQQVDYDNSRFSGISSHADLEKQHEHQQQQQSYLGSGLRVVPVEEWEGRMRQLLTQTPTAIVGEIGIDRSSTIPGTRVKTSLQHQLELVKRQMSLAAEFQRPVSIHCVRGYGHLLDLLTSLSQQPATSWPSKIMLHSYGGSVEDIARFSKIIGLGDRVYYSFSHAINHRTPEKLRTRIAAVPDDRLLIESDQVTPLVIDDSLLQICHTVSEVKGWSVQETAQRMCDNFKAFYAVAVAS